MPRTRYLLVVLDLIVVASVLAWMPSAYALELRCNNENIVVQARQAADAKSVCAAAGDAVRFLGGRGFQTNGKVDVKVVDKLRAPLSPTAFGGYVHAERRGYLLAYAKIAEHGTVFGLPFDRALYRSLATHEIAHAIAAANFSRPDPPIEVAEYIAYAVMLSTMRAQYRDPILERFADEKFENDLQINRLVYLLDPFRFGVLAYKHFITQEDGAAFLQQVLAGRALRDLAF